MKEIVFIIHFFYFEMLEDLGEYIDSLKEHIDFDIMMSIPDTLEDKTEIIKERFDVKIIKVMPNGGRDVLPFLKMLKYTEGYKYCCKIHTKTNKGSIFRGKYTSNKTWRNNMWDSLLLPENANQAIREMGLGKPFFAPINLWLDTMDHRHYMKNLDNMKKLSDIVGIEIKAEPFVAGTMFWFRPESLLWLSEIDFEYLFEMGPGADDGKMEHTFERAFHQLTKIKE
jgi:lipopolysaccharide biosynthesis protein